MTRILVVEDEPGIALGLEEDLTLEGYDVEVVGDGEAAVRRARERAFDLILLDVMLPKQGRVCKCAASCAGPAWPTPIILLTARAAGGREGRSGSSSAPTTTSRSPSARSSFGPASRRCCADQRGRRAGESIDSATSTSISRACELRRAGELVDVTPVEFKLLTAFVRSRGRVLTREQLLDQVWGRDPRRRPRRGHARRQPAQEDRADSRPSRAIS